MLGVTSQTIENWGKAGVLNVKRIGAKGHAHYVDKDTITALSDTLQDVAHARAMLEQEMRDIAAAQKAADDMMLDMRSELGIINKFKAYGTRKDFYLAIPDMLHSLGVIPARVCEVMKSIIGGQGFGEVSENIGVSRERVRQMFVRGCRLAGGLKGVKERLDDYHSMKAELNEARETIKVMNNELKFLRHELNIRQQKAIEASDGMLQKFQKRITECNFSVRVMNGLKAYDVETVGDICKCTLMDLAGFRTLGKKSIDEIRDYLDSVNLSLGMDVDGIWQSIIEKRMNND